MRKSRKQNVIGGIESGNTLPRAPWPKWAVVSTPTQNRYFCFDAGISPELYQLAEEFSTTIYYLRLELKAKSLMHAYDTAMLYLQGLSRCPEVPRPQSIGEISAKTFVDFQDLLSRPADSRPVMKEANSEQRQKVPVKLRALVKDAWRLGIAKGATRPDLGKHGLRRETAPPPPPKQIYSKREFKEIVRFLVMRLDVPRGTTLQSERAYLVTCIFLLAVFLPLNRSSAFMLTNNSLHPGEKDSKFDVIVLLKNRPKQSANRLPEAKESTQSYEETEEEVRRGGRLVRRIFEENIAHNKQIGGDEDGPLFSCVYDWFRGYDGISGPINDASFRMGVNVIHEEFKASGDDGKPLRISISKLRDTLLNRVGKNVPMRDKARLMNHRNLDTTGTDYETVTDDDHRNFQKGLKTISIVARGTHSEALVWARSARIDPEVVQYLIRGMNKTKVASCSDPFNGEFAPHNGDICRNVLACITCNALAVVASDLYRLASLERRIQLDLDDSVLQGESRPKFVEILRVVRDEIFSNFETRLVKIARQKALRKLHPLWDRPIHSFGL